MIIKVIEFSDLPYCIIILENGDPKIYIKSQLRYMIEQNSILDHCIIDQRGSFWKRTFEDN